MSIANKKVVIITGAASPKGIGKATALLTKNNNWTTVILDNNQEFIEQTTHEFGPEHLTILCDITKKDDCLSAIEMIIAKYGRIDALINNAGITQAVTTLNIDDNGFQKILDVNVLGTLHMSQAVIPYMQKQNSGSIVCISSVSAQRGGGIFGGPHYSASKAAVLGLSKAMAREFGKNNIRVNSIAPGLIETDITEGKLSSEMRADIVKTIPLDRLGHTNDIAQACLFLISDSSEYITGSTLDVNGGMHMH